MKFFTLAAVVLLAAPAALAAQGGRTVDDFGMHMHQNLVARSDGYVSQNAAARAHSLASRAHRDRASRGRRSIHLDDGKKMMRRTCKNKNTKSSSSEDSASGSSTASSASSTTHKSHKAASSTASSSSTAAQSSNNVKNHAAAQPTTTSSTASSSSWKHHQHHHNSTSAAPSSSTHSRHQSQATSSSSHTYHQNQAKAPSSTSSKAATSSTSSTSSSSSAAASSTGSSDLGSAVSSAVEALVDTVFSGEGTFFTPDTGSCGWSNTDSDYIVALSHTLYDKYTSNGNSNDNSLCGAQIKATYNGNSVTVTVADRCTGCAEDDLDFTSAAFQQLASLDTGRITGMEWHFTGN